MIYHMQFPTVDVLTVNTNRNVTVASQTTTVCCLSMQFHDSAIDCEFQQI